jgi:hypothetical protein
VRRLRHDQLDLVIGRQPPALGYLAEHDVHSLAGVRRAVDDVRGERLPTEALARGRQRLADCVRDLDLVRLAVRGLPGLVVGEEENTDR